MPTRPPLPAALALLLLASPMAARADGGDCDGDVDDLLAEVQARGAEPAYLCLAARDDAGPVLLAAAQAIGPETEHPARVSRALALHLMQRLDRPLTDDEARALPAVDRRLLRDAVQARRGRPSPVPEHEALFRKFSWYRPDSSWSKSSLTGLDRQNMALLDAPPKAPKAPKGEGDGDEAAIAALADAPQATPAGAGACGGCASGPGAPVGAGLSLLGALLARARRRR